MHARRRQPSVRLVSLPTSTTYYLDGLHHDFVFTLYDVAVVDNAADDVRLCERNDDFNLARLTFLAASSAKVLWSDNPSA